MREKLKIDYNKRTPYLERLCSALETESRDTLHGLKHIDRISFRVKNATSFLGKAINEHGQLSYKNPLSEIEDQVAGRVIVFFLGDIEIVKKKLLSSFRPIEQAHRKPTKDEEFSYESHHMICVIPPQLRPQGWDSLPEMPTTFELQVRTIFMHAYAEPQHDIHYKGTEDLPKTIKRELAWIAASAWGADQALERLRQWEDTKEKAQGS